MIKLLVVGQERESILEDLAHISLVEVDLLDRDHPDPVSRPSRHPEVHYQSIDMRHVVEHTVEYAIEPQEHVLTVEGPIILPRTVQVHAILDHLLHPRDQLKFLPREVLHQLAEVEAEAEAKVGVVHLEVRVL